MITFYGRAVKALARSMYWVSVVAIVCIVFLTIIDVTMRKFGAPIDFVFEVVCALAGIVIGFALPQTSLDKGHVVVEFLESRIHGNWLRAVHVLTRCIGIVIFIIIGWNAIRLGTHLRLSGQYSPILQIPDFPLAYGLAVGCFVECLVLLHMMLENPEEKPS